MFRNQVLKGNEESVMKNQKSGIKNKSVISRLVLKKSLFILLLGSFFSCTMDSDFSDDLKKDFSSTYTFYSKNPNLEDSPGVAIVSYPIGTELEKSDLPNTNNSESIFAMNPGYKLSNGWVYYQNPSTQSDELPPNIITDTEDSSGIVQSVTVTSELASFYADGWAPITYYVLFHGNGGKTAAGETVSGEKSFTYNEDTTLTENEFERSNYDFAGWGTSASQSPNFPSYEDKQPLGETSGVNLANREGAIVSLYALWLRSQITITFDSNANDGVGGTVTDTVGEQTISFASLPANLTSSTFTREGHTFLYWNTASNGSGTYFYPGEQITQANYPLNDTTLYAQWQINSYTVDFDSQGGSTVSSQTVNWNQKATEPSAPTRTGYDFKGWYASDDGGITLSDTAFDFSTPITENKILYAKWSVQSITFKFNANASDVSTTMADKTILWTDLEDGTEYGNYISLDCDFDRTASGYTFAGWSNVQNASSGMSWKIWGLDKYWWESLRQNASGDITVTLYAQWDDIYYFVNFDTAGGIWSDSKLTETQYVKWHTTATEPNAPTKTGYTFSGWYVIDTDNGQGTNTKFDFSTLISSDTSLYAKWDSLTLLITYDANVKSGENGSVSGSMSPQTINGDDLTASTTLTPNTFTREGYNFLGWSKSASATSVDFVDCATISDSNWDSLYSSAGTTLYAVWEETWYPVCFIDSITGNLIDSQTVCYWQNNSKVTRPATDPTKTGYVFKGWYDSSLATEFDFDTQISSNTTIYAKWEAEKLTITFNENGGTGTMATQTLSYDSLPQNLTANVFSKEGYNFTGWATSSTGARKYADRETISTSNWASVRTSETITLYAVWEIKKFTVTFIDALDSTTLSSQTVEYNGTITTPSNPTKTHYTFLAWDDTNLIPTAMESAANLSTPVTADRSIWAKWTPDTYTVTFDGNGATSGSMLPMVFAYGVSQTLTASAFEKSGYLFGGWALSSTAATTAFGDEAVLNAESDMTLYAMWTSRGSVSRENGLVAQLDEENEQIIFSAGGIYTSYTWMIDGVSYGSGESITVPYNSSYANGSNHFVLLIGVDADGESNAESANFKILPKN